ncbi:phosphodiesterase [Gallibacterium salpingitidis]|uniref:CCA-adding enzyme n=1 Tax=Gallibacterium salpingitidis TaxID=505341 RepID=A0AB36E5R1_9PAST|nr:phosphodiesterase [Gallibacterium salpingitidis]OBX07329.1 phosphodiesterase [Gallibacterium salpingitidis]OBX10729.1 phosphodiesterase [Gallibacterium salpingitidis]WKS98972.1 CCA tRNA nucleotidyltransferase [Gallibacterium salpingitidis]
MAQQPEIYLVGGAVRDRLLGLPVTDKDWLVVHATPDDLLKQGYLQVGKDFPVFLHPQTKQEYALARTERKTGKGYTGFCCDFSPEITLEQDLIRRDLTINAIAEDLQGNLHDPYNGIADLKQKKLRHISAAFSEDPLRVLRVARFAARFYPLGFTIADETLALMKKMVASGELQALTAERVWLETEKALSYAHPEIYFQVLAEVGAITLFNELAPLFDQANPHLSETLVRLNLLIAEMSELEQKTLRFAFFFVSLYLQNQQIAEQQTLQQIQLQIQQLCQRYKAPSAYLDNALLAVQFVNNFSQTASLTSEEIITLFDQLDCWRKPQRLTNLCLLYRAIFNHFTLAQQQQWLQWYQQAKAVDVQQIIAAGFRQQHIKLELYHRRILAISQ